MGIEEAVAGNLPLRQVAAVRAAHGQGRPSRGEKERSECSSSRSQGHLPSKAYLYTINQLERLINELKRRTTVVEVL
jgi:transposase-like protein